MDSYITSSATAEERAVYMQEKYYCFKHIAFIQAEIRFLLGIKRTKENRIKILIKHV